MPFKTLKIGRATLAASWTCKANVKFVATDPKRYRLASRSDGLYCLKKIGTMIIVK